jgi:hemerythrin-like metal-binding protein
MIEGKSGSVMKEIMKELVDYTETHFSHEEQFLTANDWKDIANHKKIHRTFVDKIVQVQKEIESGKVTVSSDIMEFLKDWLMSHIVKTDKEYGKFYSAKGIK